MDAPLCIAKLTALFTPCGFRAAGAPRGCLRRRRERCGCPGPPTGVVLFLCSFLPVVPTESFQNSVRFSNPSSWDGGDQVTPQAPPWGSRRRPSPPPPVHRQPAMRPGPLRLWSMGTALPALRWAGGGGGGGGGFIAPFISTIARRIYLSRRG